MNDNNNSKMGGVAGVLILLCLVFSKSCGDNHHINSVSHFFSELGSLLIILGVMFVVGYILYLLIKLGTVTPANEDKNPSKSPCDASAIDSSTSYSLPMTSHKSDVALDDPYYGDFESAMEELDDEELAEYILRNKL